MKDKFSFFATYLDANGHEHYAVHFYNRVSGFVDMMRDVKDDNARYPLTDVLDLKYQEETKRYAVRLDRKRNTYQVFDTLKDVVVATFPEVDGAKDWCDFKNNSEKYA